MINTADRSRRRVGVGSELACCIALILAQNAWAEQRRFDIPESDAVLAIPEFARQAGLQIVAPADELKGVRTAALKGEIETREALKALLVGTGLEIATDDGALITLRRVGTHGLQRISDSGSADAAIGPGLGTLQEVIVRGVRFRYEEVESANKMPMSVKDTPQSVKVVTQDLIEFAGIRGFEDIYKVDASGGTSHAGDQNPRNYYRGFRVQSVNGIKVDGFRMTAYMELDLAPFERFEVIKGATSTLYGQNSVGGTLNAISKMPKPDFGGELKLEAGSFDHYRGDVDIYGPLAADGRLTYRLIAAYQDEGSYVDFVDGKRKVLAPTLKYEFSDDTSVTARVTYLDYDFSPYYGFGTQFLGDDISDPEQLVPQNFRIPSVARSRSGNAPGNSAHKEALFAQTLLEHRMGDWKLRGSLQYSRVESDLRSVLLRQTYQDGVTDANLYQNEALDSVYSGEVNLFGDVEAFGATHTLFLGLDYSRLSGDFDYYSSDVAGSESGFSIFHPNYDLITLPTRQQDFQSAYYQSNKRDMSGVTAQALLRPVDGLTVSLGTRYSHDVLENRWACCDFGQALKPDDALKENALTYQAGVTYALTPHHNVYAGYGTTFEPQTGMTPSGARIDPEEGTSYEVGFKGELLNNGLSYSLAVFHMERSGISQGVPGTNFVMPVGTQQSEGVELDFQGHLVKGWELYASFAWLDAEYSKGEFKGVQPANAAKFGLSLFTSYEIQTGVLRGLGFGGGVVHKRGRHTADLFGYGAKTPINFLNDFTEVDLRAFYSWNRYQFDLSVSNAFNEKYYSPVFESLGIAYQVNPSLAVTASVRYRF